MTLKRANERLLIFADASSVHTQRWVAQMAQRGLEVHVVTRLLAPVPGAASVRVVQAGRGGLGWFKALPEIRRITRELAPHWVHGHYVTSYGLWAAACGHHPMILTAWGSDILVTPRKSWFMRQLVAWSLRRADLITADSMDMLEAITAYHPHGACHLISWGADCEFFVPAGRLAAGFDLVSMRSWEPNYNIETVVLAFAKFVDQHDLGSSRLHLLGGGSLEPELRELVRRLNLSAQVVFHGRVDDAAMRAVLQACRISVSVPTSDATSVSVLESMACGLTIIASDLAANRACLMAQGEADRAGGLFVPAAQVDALAGAMSRVFELPDQGQSMGLRNRAWVLAHASRRTHMNKMASLVHRLKVRP